MEARAYLKYARISPRKVCIVLDLIRGKSADEAMGILKNTHKSASEYLIKLLNSAVANAENNFGMDIDNLVVSEAYVGKAMVMKRFAAAAKGRACRIIKPFSNLTIIVAEQEKTLAKSEKSAKIGNSEKKTATKKQVSKKEGE